MIVKDAQPALKEMTSTAKEIVREVGSMQAECLYWKPGPEVWTVMDNLCHIVEFVPYWTRQIHQIVAAPGELWGRTHHDPDRLSAVSNTSYQQLHEVEREVISAVELSARVLAALSDAQLDKEAPSRNPRWGLKSARFVLDVLLVKHLESHLAQIRRNLSQFEQARDGQHPQEG